MSDVVKTNKVVKGVMTTEGVAQVDYNSLANVPDLNAIMTSNIQTSVESGAIQAALAKKVDAADGKAPDSALFGGKAPEYYATKTSVDTLNTKVDTISEQLESELEGTVGEALTTINGQIQVINNNLDDKLDKTAQAADSAKLNGQSASYYATKEQAADAQTTADNAMTLAQTVKDTAIPKASFNLSGTTLTITL